MKNEKIKHLIFWLIVISLTVICNSCGARKSDILKKQEDSKTETLINSSNSSNSTQDVTQSETEKTASNTKTEQQNTEQTEEFTVEPIDSTKPSVYIGSNGEKHILQNAKIHYGKKNLKTKTNSSNSSNSDKFHSKEAKEKKQSLTNLQAKEKSEKKVDQKTKSTTKEAFSPWNYLLFLLPLALMFLACRVYKNLNPLTW